MRLNKKDIFINTASQIVVRFFTLAFALVSVKLLTNYLGPAGVGNYNTITTYISFFIVIADLGLFSVTVREISKNPENEKKIISNVFTIRLISALLATIIAVSIAFFTNYTHDIKFGILVASGFLFFNLLASIFDMILQHRLKMQFSAFAEFLSKLVSLLALFIIIKNHGDFLWVVSTFALSGIVIFIFKWIFASKYIKIVFKHDRELTKTILSASIPLGLVFIINNIFFKLDTLLLFAMKGAVSVGIYSVAYKVLEVTIFAGSYFASSLKPILSKSIESDKPGVSNIISKSITVMLLLAIPISVLSIVFSSDIIVFLSNNDFISGSSALIILSATLPFVYIDVLLGEILVASDQKKLLVKIAIFILSFNLILNLILIPKFSFIGAAYVTLASEIVLMLINYYYTKKIIDYKINVNQITKILFVSLLTYVIGIFIRNIIPVHFLFQMLIVGIAFGILAYSFGIIKLGSIKNIMAN